MASAFELQIPPGSNPLYWLAVALEDMWNYECAIFEKYLIPKTTPSALMSQVFLEDARKLEVRCAGKARKELLARRAEKSREMAGIKAFPIDALNQVFVPMDFEVKTLIRLSRPEADDPFLLPLVFLPIFHLEKHRMKTSCETWKNISTSSSRYLAEAVFAAYPDSRCANDPELFEIMAARGCAVFDFAGNDDTVNSKSPVPLAKILPDGPGVSLLRCPEEWLPQLTKFARSNPCIMAIEIPTSPASQSKSEYIIEEHRRNWGTNTPLLDEDDIVSYFCFSSNFKAQGTYMSAVPSGSKEFSTGFLVVKTAQAGTFRVTFWHHPTSISMFNRPGNLSWSLRTGGSPLHGTIELPNGKGFRRDSFTLEVPSAGLHQIDIRINITNYETYKFRKVWVTLVNASGDPLVMEGWEE
ncbi:hypothetical protein FB451DRAFT_1398544 [Mycena latifolia]|nr:hypothetical protein FB451DRAFT_1398544 [Mycena latifolia]